MTHPVNSAQNIYLSAFRRGKEAARDGKRSTANPYHFTKDLPRNAAWRDGFYAERDKMRDERQREVQKSMDAKPANWVPLSGVRDNKRVARPALEPRRAVVSGDGEVTVIDSQGTMSPRLVGEPVE